MMKIEEETFYPGDKERVIIIGKHLKLSIDYDDVDHDKVDKAIKKLLKILNENWK